MRVTKKEIPRGNSRLEIRTEDLLLPEDLERNRDKSTLKSSLANVGLPSTAYWKRLLFNSFLEIYIVHRSPTTSPASSKNNSPENSQHVSPATTFPVDTPHPRTRRSRDLSPCGWPDRGYCWHGRLSHRFRSACLIRPDSSPQPPIEAVLAAFMRTSSSIHNTKAFLMIPDAPELANGVGQALFFMVESSYQLRLLSGVTLVLKMSSKSEDT
ncbi:hypothetical protein PSPO01_15589 [Paraphaeosphaeria sporulosa]